MLLVVAQAVGLPYNRNYISLQCSMVSHTDRKQEQKDRHSGNRLPNKQDIFFGHLQHLCLFLENELVDELILLRLHFRQSLILNSVSEKNQHAHDELCYLLSSSNNCTY